jgi:hypothetical protein
LLDDVQLDTLATEPTQSWRRARQEGLPTMSSAQEQTTAAESDDGSRAALIARLAYEKWQQRGCPPGDDLRDWLDAEREIAAAAPKARPKAAAGANRTKRA